VAKASFGSAIVYVQPITNKKNIKKHILKKKSFLKISSKLLFLIQKTNAINTVKIRKKLVAAVDINIKKTANGNK
tara:strand:+ start:94 stop:318 length:225 start_codon:yes stop_codon:yes gene_type:complete